MNRRQWLARWFAGASALMARQALALDDRRHPEVDSGKTDHEQPPSTPAPPKATAKPAASPPEATAVVAAMSALRQDPRAYAAMLKTWLPLFDGKVLRRPGQPGLLTQEGAAAVQEAIAVLERCPPLAPVQWRDGLGAAALEHVVDQRAHGGFGHAGSDGSLPIDRMRRYARIRGVAAECITYGPQTAADIVLQLVVDDGVPDRGHRRNMLHPRLVCGGVATGDHPSGRVMCVIDHAEDVLPREG